MKLRSMLCCLLLGSATAAGAASITVDASKPGPRFAPTMYGLFFEEINHSGDGGLYAELVRNRGFEDYRTSEKSVRRSDGWWISAGGHGMKPDLTNDGLGAWSVVARGGSGATAVLDREVGLNDKTSSSLRLEIPGVQGAAGIVNEGYWGISVKSGEKYNLSYHAKGKGPYPGKLTAYLEDSKGQPLSDQVVSTGAGKDWTRFTGTLTGTGTDPQGRLVILADARGTLWFDFVSLFPARTFKNRPNGFRPDLMQMLADIQPGFLRWPGGCIVEGVSLANAFNWKDTIGPVEERPGKWNLWGYRRTDGFGYFEFLQLCEDLGVEPLLVVNCGMSCQWRSPEFAPLDKMGPFVQDALDAIEYANGPVTSKWGALRAQAGHPEPFRLKYLEIGNENWGNEYAERYNILFDAVKKRYPDIITIADNVLPGMQVEINDEHYYNKPEFFQMNASKYDSYDRKAHKVFLGEIACTEGIGQIGNLRAALGEAAFLIGAERNPDIVQLISYAPLLVNTNDRKWVTNAIVFDSSRAFGIPSYYVYQMFGNNRPDVALPLALEAEAVDPAFPGKVGVGSVAETTAEFKDVRVEKGGKILLAQPDFTKGTDGWETSGGKWEVVDGCLRQEKDGKALAGERDWENYTFTVKARKVQGNEGFCVYFSSGPVGDCRLNLGGWGNTQHGLDLFGVETPPQPGKIETGKWYEVKVALQGATVECFLDGQRLFKAVRPVTTLFASAGREEKTGDIIVKVSNPTKTAYETQMRINGAGTVAAKGREIVMTSADPWDENSFEEPTKVVPVEREVDGLGAAFKHTFKPYSLTVLRLRTK